MLWFLVRFGFSVSEAALLVESQPEALSFQKVYLVFKVCFLRRFEFQVVSVTGALKLRLIEFLIHVKLVLAKRQLTPNPSLGFGN
ncbi:TPA: hypothetical protein ACMDVB_000415 [Vibrio parahaemolyticus]